MIENQVNYIKFSCLDYTKQDKFQSADYEFIKNSDQTWTIKRNSLIYLQLSKGYRPLKIIACGICSTDLDRRFLPFALPQVIGHEIIATDIENSSQRYVVEINDTFSARGDPQQDQFCKNNLATHSPERKILGIDRLPGGFGPFILAPQNAIIPFHHLEEDVAVLIEPFAACLQAIISNPPKNEDKVAVLGPRRLGSLLLAALKAYRFQKNLNYTISAIVRHQNLEKLAFSVGADFVMNSNKIDINELNDKFDIVYDTTSTNSGFETALLFAKRQVHLKTTNGQIMAGIKHLTELVVDQLSLIPAQCESSLKFCWDTQKRQNKSIYISPKLINKYQHLKQKYQIFSGDPSQALKALKYGLLKFNLPRFDLAIAGSPEDIEKCIRPCSNSQQSLVRPRGAILVDTENESDWQNCNKLRVFFASGKKIHSTRCGNFHLALKLLTEYPQIGKNLSKNLISNVYSSENLPEAYKKARQPSSIKVIIKHNIN